MYVKKKKNRSGTTSVIVDQKSRQHYKELITIGVSSNNEEIEQYIQQGKEWILEQIRKEQPELDLYGEETTAKSETKKTVPSFAALIVVSILLFSAKDNPFYPKKSVYLQKISDWQMNRPIEIENLTAK